MTALGLLLAPGRMALGAIEGIAALASIEREMRGMRGDMRAVIDEISGLRADVQSLTGGVGGIRVATESLDAKIDEIGVHLEGVAALTGRLGRFGARRSRANGE